MSERRGGVPPRPLVGLTIGGVEVLEVVPETAHLGKHARTYRVRRGCCGREEFMTHRQLTCRRRHALAPEYIGRCRECLRGVSGRMPGLVDAEPLPAGVYESERAEAVLHTMLAQREAEFAARQARIQARRAANAARVEAAHQWGMSRPALGEADPPRRAVTAAWAEAPRTLAEVLRRAAQSQGRGA